jgi:hypothetical protein
MLGRSTYNSLVSRIRKKLHIRPSAVGSTGTDSRSKGFRSASSYPARSTGSLNDTSNLQEDFTQPSVATAETTVTPAMALFEAHIARTHAQSQCNDIKPLLPVPHRFPPQMSSASMQHSANEPGSCWTTHHPHRRDVSMPAYQSELTASVRRSTSVTMSIKPETQPKHPYDAGSSPIHWQRGSSIVQAVRDGDVRLLVTPIETSLFHGTSAKWVNRGGGLVTRDDVSHLRPFGKSFMNEVNEEQKRRTPFFKSPDHDDLSNVIERVIATNQLSGNATFGDMWVGIKGAPEVSAMSVLKHDIKDNVKRRWARLTKGGQ